MGDSEEAFIEAAKANNVSELRQLIAAGVDKDNTIDEEVCLLLLFLSGSVPTGTRMCAFMLHLIVPVGRRCAYERCLEECGGGGGLPAVHWGQRQQTEY
jgi:hypothetical protein